MNACKTESPERMQKHMDLLAGVDRVTSVRTSLARLLAEISGKNMEKPEPDAKVSVEPNLSFVLNQTGSRLAAEAEEMHNIISSIRDELF